LKDKIKTEELICRKTKKTKNTISVSCCLNKFSNIGRTMDYCQMSKADAGHVDFLIRTKLIGL
jgi:hypothetical protein